MGSAVHSYRIDPHTHPPVMEVPIEKSPHVGDVIVAASSAFRLFADIRRQMMYIKTALPNSGEPPNRRDPGFLL
jgi:hypothetical protein